MAYKTSIVLVSVLSVASFGLQKVVTSEVSKANKVDEERLKSLITQKYDLKEDKITNKLPSSMRVEAESRRVNPLRLLMNRPRVSPLYLINGTVCRFVNFQPICTTLSTTGIPGKLIN